MRLVVGDPSRRTAEEEGRLAELSAAVYPPDAAATWPGRNLDWSPAQFDVWVIDEHDNLVSYAAVVIRDATVDGDPVIIGGVGGVKTRPDERGRGFAAAAMEEASRIWAERAADFGLLVCQPGLIPYYTRLGWMEFDGTLLTLQKGRLERFEFNRVMLLPVSGSPPRTGVIDLKGPPW